MTDGPDSDRAARVAAWTRQAVQDLQPYYQAPLQGSPLRLDQNTNLLGPNPVLQAIQVQNLGVDQYPTRDSDILRAALARHHGRGLAAENFACTNGSDEALDLLCRTFTEPGCTLATTRPGYSLYPFYAKVHDLAFEDVPLAGSFGSWRLDVDRLLAAAARLTIVASPNNPTGNAFATNDLERLVQESPGIVVIDEAYIEYATDRKSFLPYVEHFDNLVVLRTFSKAHGLAGLRVGYLAANSDLMQRLLLAKPPYNLNLIAEHAAAASLDEPWVARGVATVQAEREHLEEALRQRGFKVQPSDSNFLLTLPPIGHDAGALYLGLKQRGILARTFPNKPMVQDTIRFTVAGPDETSRLLHALDEVLVS